MTLEEWVTKELEHMNVLASFETLYTDLTGQPRRKQYRWLGGTLNWEENIPPEKMAALKDGEVFILLDKDKQPYTMVMRDAIGDLREKKVILTW